MTIYEEEALFMILTDNIEKIMKSYKYKDRYDCYAKLMRNFELKRIFECYNDPNTYIQFRLGKNDYEISYCWHDQTLFRVRNSSDKK